MEKTQTSHIKKWLNPYKIRWNSPKYGIINVTKNPKGEFHHVKYKRNK